MPFQPAYARNRHMRIAFAESDDIADRIERHAQIVYDRLLPRADFVSRVHVESYTDEIHVFLRRVNSNRLDFVASYQAE